jgi:glycosyltransferase involved in cell wall biosynthesis
MLQTAVTAGAARPIILCFGVVDEADIIEDFIEYHLHLGIDGLVATDVGSTDGTLDILALYERRGCLQLIRYHDPTRTGLDHDIAAGMLRVAREYYQADWCLFCDADEFWVFPGDVGAYLASVPDPVVTFPRYNMVPVRESETGLAHFSKFDLVVRRPLNFVYDLTRWDQPDGLALLRDGYPPEILRAVGPKVVARADAIRSVGHGFHEVVPRHGALPHYREQAGYVAHFPVRSLAQWRRKMALITKLIDRNPPEKLGGLAWHWVRYATLAKHDLIDEEFHRQVLSQQDIAAWRREGVLLRDATLARRLGQINSTRFRVDGAL